MDYVVAGIILALLPVVVARPFVGAVLYTAIAYLRPQNLVGGIAMDLRLSLCVLAALVVGLAIARVRGTEKPLVATPWFVLVAFLLCIQGLTVQTAVFEDLAWADWMDFCRLMAGVGLTLSLCTSLDRVKTIAITIALALGTMSVIALVRPVWDAGRLTGAGGNFRDSNDFALALCMALPLLLCLPRVAGRWSRIAMLALVPPVVIAIVLTQSRGGFLSLAAVTAAWALTTRGRVFKLALAPAAVLAFLALAPASYLERLTTISNYQHDSSARDRLSSWRVATRIVEERPLTGVGPGNFLAVYTRYSNDLRRPHVAHNTPLQIVADAGVFALLAYSLLLLYAMFGATRLAWRARARRRFAGGREEKEFHDGVDAHGTAIALALLAYLVGSQFLSRGDLDLFYILAGLVAATAVHARRARREAILAPEPRRVRVEVPCVSAG